MQQLELLGNGASAKVYRICPTDDRTKTMLFDYNEINKITLFHQGDGPPNVISGVEKENIKELSMVLSSAYDYIWKVFKSSNALGSAEKLLQEEIGITKKINGIYGDFAGKFLTTGPIKGYKNLLIIGMSIEFKKPEAIKHILFNNYCNNKYWKDTIDIIKFCKDILESLVILNNKGYRHGDIKLDNIVKCGAKFKLIDWGLCHTLDKYMLKGDFASTSPIKYRMLSRGDDGYSDAGRFPGHIFRHEEGGLLDHTDSGSYGPIPGELSLKKKAYGAESIENESEALK
jgi:serine/threonine protein kinase